jgi:hypothetical protein
MARARILEFESDMPSQPVRLKRITYEGRAKIPRYREVSQIELVSVCEIPPRNRR